MRSLQDWMKYLEQQEQSVKQPEEETPPVQEVAKQEEIVVQPPQPVVQPEPPKPVAPPAPKVQAPPPVEEPRPVETPRVEPQPQQKPSAAQVKPVQPKPAALKPAQPAKPRKPRTPKALMPTVSRHEIAQTSYKPFKESREELLQRLLDPLISLEEAARILNVCPTTVRRYTNRGILQHHRTAGNQRRFKLSDVLAFMGAEASVQSSDE